MRNPNVIKRCGHKCDVMCYCVLPETLKRPPPLKVMDPPDCRKHHPPVEPCVPCLVKRVDMAKRSLDYSRWELELLRKREKEGAWSEPLTKYKDRYIKKKLDEYVECENDLEYLEGRFRVAKRVRRKQHFEKVERFVIGLLLRVVRGGHWASSSSGKHL
ncbi:hypothetical protein HDV00_007085 [Rhizophlyctis rosea]|nr:hypothetical protein HDV00_007085 [Rhizophlyctis rosea]